MDEKMLKAMVAAGAIKKIRIIGQGSRFHVEANTPNGAITAERVKESEFQVGYNAAENKYVDMYDIGIIDPAKVTRSTLQNAASIASMVLTTECIIVDKNDEIVSNKS